MARKQRRGDGGPRGGRIHVRVSGDELAMFRRVAGERDTTVSRMVVDAVRALAGQADAEAEERSSPTVEQLRAVRAELRRIGANVNQIAHNANRDMRASPADEAMAVLAVRECQRLIERTDALIGRSDPAA